MAFTVQDFEDLVRLLEEKPEWRERMRQLILTRELLQLPDLVRQLIESVQRLSEEFAAYRQLTDQRFAETNQQIAELVTAVRDLVRRLERLEDWQRGESGRRDGERYEQQVIARAPALFYGGSGGGMGEPHLREQLGRWLASLYRQGIEIDEHDDPLLADLIWWKGDRVMVTEVSLKVDAQDVRRAAARARTLRRVGINATPTVIGREWATPDTQALAQQEGVEWMVGSGLSQGFLEFRQISDGQEEAE